MKKKLVLSLLAFTCVGALQAAFLSDIGQGIENIGRGAVQTAEGVVEAPYEIVTGEPVNYRENRRYYGPARPAFYRYEDDYAQDFSYENNEDNEEALETESDDE